MITFDDSDDEEIEFNSILYENSKEEEIDYYNEQLPHINFYLKFQNQFFLQTFCNQLKEAAQKEAEPPKNLSHEVPLSTSSIDASQLSTYPNKKDKKEKEAKIIEIRSEENGKQQTIQNGETIAKTSYEENVNLMDNYGFCIDDKEEEEEEAEEEAENERKEDIELIEETYNEKKGSYKLDLIKNEQNELEILAQEEAVDLCKRVEEIFENGTLHLNEHEEYTKKINIFFQNSKKKFTFSIEREILINEESIKRCFICNKNKKKYNDVLSSAYIYLCHECKLVDNNFRMISLSKLINKYCLNNQDLLKYEKQLVVLLTKNPRGYTKQMKLFFLFQIKEIAIRKHGSLLNTKNLYHAKILNKKKAKSPKKKIHKWKKPKSILSKKEEMEQKQKIICDEDIHTFSEPVCIDQKENVYKKSCTKCSFYVEYMQI